MFAKSVFQTVLKLYCFHCAAAVESLTLWILKAALIRASVSEASYSWQVKATVLFTALAARDLCTLKHMVTLSVVLAERCEERNRSGGKNGIGLTSKIGQKEVKLAV